MPSSGTPSQGDSPSGKAAAGSDSPWRFVLEASPALFPNRAGTIESRAERARDGRRAAIRTVGRAEALSTLSAMSRSLRREAGAPVSSSSSDASEEDLLETTRERGSSSELRELLLSKRTSAGGAVGRETGETARRAARLAKPLERSVERALRGERDDADDTDTAGTSVGPSKISPFFNPPSPGSWTRAPANSASGTPSAAPTPSRFSASLAAQKQRLHDVLSEAARRRLEVKLQVVEEPPIMATPVQRKYIMRWVDLHRGTLRSVADVALAALKKARTDKAYAARVRAESEIARLARLERIRSQLADFRRSDPRARWKKACDALHFVSYVKHLATLSRKANATAAVRRQRLEREAAERAAAEARGETPVPVRANDTRDVEGAPQSASGDVARSAGPATDDPITLRDAEKARLASSLRATKKALETRFDRGADENKSADDDDGDFGFEPRLGRANAAALAARKATRDMGEKEYRELSFALKEEEKREALERIGQARREFHWRPVTRVRLAYSLPPELFLDDDEQYDDAVLAAGKTLRDAGVRFSGSRAAAALGAQGGGEEKSQSLDDAVGNLGDFDRSFKVKKKTPAAADASVVKAHYASTASRKPPEGATMDEEAARAMALERRRRAERLAAAYDANLAAARAAPETEKASASSDDEGPATTFGTHAFGTHAFGGRSRSLGVFEKAPPPPMRFGVSDASRGRGELLDELLDDDGDVRRLGLAARELPRRREEKAARVKHYGKWYVPARARSAAAFAESERVWAETRGGAPAAEIKALQARESQLAARHQRSYAAKIYKSWLDARVGENARLPAYMRDVEAQEDRTWWEKSAQDRVREENERLARSRAEAGAQTLRFAPL